MAGVARRRKQLVDQRGPLVGILGVEQRDRLLVRRDRAGDVEIDAADELLVGGERVGLDAVLLVIGLHQCIDPGRGQPGPLGRLRIDLGDFDLFSRLLDLRQLAGRLFARPGRGIALFLALGGLSGNWGGEDRQKSGNQEENPYRVEGGNPTHGASHCAARSAA